ncbi:hypothetical protein B0H13DRAFT_1895628 [Mycena leptocephala]|nr:hypothetical protein B0H13DRAFT_1895628 [Mycena leptocephala]
MRRTPLVTATSTAPSATHALPDAPFSFPKESKIGLHRTKPFVTAAQIKDHLAAECIHTARYKYRYIDRNDKVEPDRQDALAATKPSAHNAVSVSQRNTGRQRNSIPPRRRDSDSFDLADAFDFVDAIRTLQMTSIPACVQWALGHAGSVLLEAVPVILLRKRLRAAEADVVETEWGLRKRFKWVKLRRR